MFLTALPHSSAKVSDHLDLKDDCSPSPSTNSTVFRLAQYILESASLDGAIASFDLYDHCDQAGLSLAAYEYLCTLKGTPITNASCLVALKSAQDSLSRKEHNHKFTLGPGNIGANIEKTNYDSIVCLQAQTSLAQRLVAVLLGLPSDYYCKESDRASLEQEEQMKACWSPELVASLSPHFSDNPAEAADFLFPLAYAACAWVGGAFNCGEVSSSIMYAHTPELTEDQELQRVYSLNKSTYDIVHMLNRLIGAGFSIDLDGWIGQENLKTPVLTKHAYHLPSTFSHVGSSSIKGYEFKVFAHIKQLFELINGNEVVKDYFSSIFDAMQNRADSELEKGYTWEEGADNFIAYPLLNDDFRAESRDVLQVLQSGKVSLVVNNPNNSTRHSKEISFDIQSLNQVIVQKGWEFKPSVIRAIVQNANALIEKSSVEKAIDFVLQVQALEKMDGSCALSLIDRWLNSSQFKSWEIFTDIGLRNSITLFTKLNLAFKKIPSQEQWGVFQSLFKQLPFLLARCTDHTNKNLMSLVSQFCASLIRPECLSDAEIKSFLMTSFQRIFSVEELVQPNQKWFDIIKSIQRNLGVD